MVIRPTIVCEMPYRWLKCSSLNPCLNLQRVKNILPLRLIVLVFLAWGHLHHTCDYSAELAKISSHYIMIYIVADICQLLQTRNIMDE